MRAQAPGASSRWPYDPPLSRPEAPSELRHAPEAASTGRGYGGLDGRQGRPNGRARGGA
jgi:hypothetical protein